MPIKNEVDHKRLPRHLDRRVKLTDEDKAEIKHLFHVEGWAIRKIARHFADKCTRRVIQYTIDPERYELLKAQFKKRRLDKRYYKREQNTKAVKSTRKHRRHHNNQLI